MKDSCKLLRLLRINCEFCCKAATLFINVLFEKEIALLKCYKISDFVHNI